MFEGCFDNSDWEEDWEYYECQTRGVVSDSIVQNWTRSALDCYNINSNCSICPIARGHYSFKCQMKHIVSILLKTKGEPQEEEILRQCYEAA